MQDNARCLNIVGNSTDTSGNTYNLHRIVTSGTSVLNEANKIQNCGATFSSAFYTGITSESSQVNGITGGNIASQAHSLNTSSNTTKVYVPDPSSSNAKVITTDGTNPISVSNADLTSEIIDDVAEAFIWLEQLVLTTNNNN